MEAPAIEGEPIEHTGALPSDTTDLPPPQTEEGGQSEDGSSTDDSEELPPPINDGEDNPDGEGVEGAD